jgi:hypothetical protein
MATVKIWDSDARDGVYPAVCAVCGAETDEPHRQTFSWSPPWAVVSVALFGVLGALLISANRRTKKVVLPVCPECRGHWFNRQFLGWVGLSVGVALLVLGVTMERQWGKAATEVVLFGGFGVMILTVITALVFRGIRAVEITDHTITLSGVSAEFARGLEANAAEDAAGAINLKRAGGGVELQMDRYLRQ